MGQYFHPKSDRLIHGTQLAFGAVLREADQYDSSDGSWRTAPWCAGLTLQEGCTTIWIRQGAELSPEGRELLSCLVQWNFCLTQRSGQWIVIPSARWKYDGRMHWGVTHPECVQELINYGFIAPQPVNLTPEELGWERSWPQPGDVIYYLTEPGRREVGGN